MQNSSKSMTGLNWLLLAGLGVYWVVGAAQPAQAMHIMEGYLPPAWAIFWWVVFLPFLV